MLKHTLDKKPFYQYHWFNNTAKYHNFIVEHRNFQVC